MQKPDVYLVGGAVRDKLLGRPSHDKDFVVVGSTPEQMLEAGFLQVGADFPVFLHPTTHHEYALARTERKSGTGYQGFSVHATPDVSLEDDLKRRDLTLNAMAVQVQGLFDDTPYTGQIIDPYGGQQDIQDRVLRHVSHAFCEDPLRVLRVARFYGRLFDDNMPYTIAPDTKVLMQQMSEAGELAHLSIERIWTETERALMQQHPFAYIECLFELGALKQVMPALHTAFDNSDTRHIIKHMLTHLACLNQPIQVRWSGLMSALLLSQPQASYGNVPNTQMQLAWQEQTQTLASTLKIPKRIAKFTQHFIASYALLGQSFQQNAVTAEQIETLIDALKLHKHPEYVAPLLQTVHTLNHYWQQHWLQQCIWHYQSVSISDIDANLKGADIGHALKNKRVQAIAKGL